MAESILKLKIQSDDYDNKIKRASEGLQRYVDGCRKAGGTLEVVEKETLAFVQSLGKMDTVSRTAKGSLGELTRGFTDLSVQYNKLTEEEKKSPFGKELKSSLDQLKTRIMDSKAEIQNIEKELGGATMKTGDFSSVMGDLGSKLGINGDLMGMVTTGTVGMTAAITAGTAAVAAATKAWADYNSELAKQDQITTVTTGLKGADADKMTDAARSISEVYGTDFREVINAANTLMTQFGEDGSSAMQLIRDGMQGMIQGDGGKLLSMIQQYAPAFQTAGVSASQLVAVIQNSEGGIFTDQNMNAIIMALPKIRLMSESTAEALKGIGINGKQMAQDIESGSITVFQALQTISQAIDDNKDKTKQTAAVMQELFGRQARTAGDNLGRAIAELNTNLEETKTQTGEVGKSLADLEQAQEKLNSSMRETFQMKGWEEIGNKIETHFVDKLTNVVKGLGVVIDNLDKVNYALQGLIPGLASLESAFEHMGDRGDLVLQGLETAAYSLLGPLGMIANLLDAIGSGAITTQVQAAAGNKPNKAGAVIAGSAGGAVFNNSKVSTSSNIVTPKKTGGRGGGGKTTLSPAQQADAMMAKAATEYNNQLANAQEKVNVGLMTEEELQKTKLRLLEQIADKSLAAWNTSGLDKYLTTFTNFANTAVDMRENLKSVDDVLKQLDKDFPTAITSGMESQSWAESMRSAYEGDKGFGNEEKTSNFIQEIIKKGLESGVDVSDVGATLMEKLFEGMEVPDEQLQAFVDLLNRKLEELGIEPIKVDIDTKKVIGETKEMSKDWQKAASAVQAVGSAMSQIEDPAAKVIGTIAQAIATMALGYATATTQAAKLGPWAWVAFAATGLATMISSISAIKSNAKFAEGGIVKGNSYSGDNLLMPIDGGRGGFAGLNSGEIVLSASQQSNLAQQLQNNGNEGTNRQPYVMGEQIYLGVNTYLRRSGRGELVTSK